VVEQHHPGSDQAAGDGDALGVVAGRPAGHMRMGRQEQGVSLLCLQCCLPNMQRASGLVCQSNAFGGRGPLDHRRGRGRCMQGPSRLITCKDASALPCCPLPHQALGRTASMPECGHPHWRSCAAAAAGLQQAALASLAPRKLPDR
jgi:hypothetical protein